MIEKNTDFDLNALDKKPATDIFSEFDELDELEVSEESPISNYQDLIDEAKAKKGYIEEPLESSLEDELNTTLDIDNYKDDILEKLDEIKNEKIDEPIKEIFEDIKDEDLENKDNTLEDSKALQTAFIYTSIVGFIILFICYGIYLYFLAH